MFWVIYIGFGCSMKHKQIFQIKNKKALFIPVKITIDIKGELFISVGIITDIVNNFFITKLSFLLQNFPSPSGLSIAVLEMV